MAASPGASIGRFMKPDDGTGQDPTNPQSWNLYSYVLNNPTTDTDPDGHDCVYAESSSVSVVRGDCLSDKDNGAYVNGTIDLKSFTYNPQGNSLGFSYTPEGAGSGTFGAGTIGLPTANLDSGAVSPEGESFLASYAGGAIVGKAAGALFGAVFGGTVRGGIGPVLKGVAGVDRARQSPPGD